MKYTKYLRNKCYPGFRAAYLIPVIQSAAQRSRRVLCQRKRFFADAQNDKGKVRLIESTQDDIIEARNDKRMPGLKGIAMINDKI